MYVVGCIKMQLFTYKQVDVTGQLLFLRRHGVVPGFLSMPNFSNILLNKIEAPELLDLRVYSISV